MAGVTPAPRSVLHRPTYNDWRATHPAPTATVHRLSPAHSYQAPTEVRLAGTTTRRHPAMPEPVTRQGGKAGGARRGTPKRPKRPTHGATPTGYGGVSLGSGSLSTLPQTTADMSGSSSTSTSSDLAALQSQYDQLSSQLSSDESTISQTQSQLDQLANAGQTQTQGSTGLLGSTTGKIIVVALVAGGGYLYWTQSKKSKSKKSKSKKEA